MSQGRATAVVKSGFYSAIGLFFEYDTPKIVHIRSKKVGIINRLLQLIIIAYIIGSVGNAVLLLQLRSTSKLVLD